MEPTVFALSIVILLFSVIVHEVMHGLAALYNGDHTAQKAGRLTLNPIAHIDPIGTILIPAALIFSGSRLLFGWAKPVPVNPFNFKDIKKGELTTSAAGVLANFFLAIFAAILLKLAGDMADPISRETLSFAVNINLVLAVFNLLPIPPLDGSKIVMTLLPAKLAASYARLEKYGLLIILLLWLIPFGRSTLLSTVLGSVIMVFQYLLGV